ncbi:response regulator transcription factor [Bacillota bacterium Meth-B3]
MYKIFIVEDDPAIAGVVARQLAAWGYEARPACDFRRVLDEFRSFGPHLTLMDISLPFCDGYHWCAEIRKVSRAPVIFLSSASDDMNVLMALNMGADDFIAKPFDLKLLMAKVQALIRRAYDFAEPAATRTHRGATLNLADATLSYGDARLELTKNEFRILELLMLKAGKLASREEIMQRLWSTDSFIDDNTLTVNVARLRKKLNDIGLNDFIGTKKGMGYIIP